MTNGQRLRRALASRKLTQAQAAKRLGVTRSYVGLLVTDRRTPSLEMAARLRRLGVEWRA